jgi:hypothetical protein
MQLIAENAEHEMKFTVICKRDLIRRPSTFRQAEPENTNGKDLQNENNSAPPQRSGGPQSYSLESSVKRTVVAPPGKFGIILKQSLHGCMIQSVKPDSPMLGILLPDDLILSFNDIVSGMMFCHS